MTIPIYLPGIAGRVGRIIAECIAEAEDMTLAAAFEAPGHPWIGKPMSELLPALDAHCIVQESALAASPAERAVSIHFTSPEATLGWLDWSVEHNCPMVIGTTGMKSEHVEQVRSAAEQIPIVLSPNMSIGVNLLFALCRQVAAITGKDYDVEITEMHHRFKKDSPSGTALGLGESVASAWGETLADIAVHGRHGMVGERPTGQIGFHALRGGDVVGDHTVTFATQGERIELSHRASSRRTFAEGALRAARFVIGKSSGFFTMQDVLGLK